ncbi:MAG: methylenetetrahydrofolate reductase [Deltaproteobacteria bacterium]|nr:methylenetetrahydrofolate reductase [Deltaproteobacteria bacterium]
MKSNSRLEAVLAAGKFALTGECGPPRGADPGAVAKKAALLLGSVDAANVTDNQTAVVRMSSMGASLHVKSAGVDPIMQMVCRDRNRIAMQSDILGAASHGISNLLCLSGDHQKFGDHPTAKNVFDLDSIQLIAMVKKMRDEEMFLGGEKIKVAPKLFIGAAENPFAHPLAIRVPRLAKKIAAGADFIQTQCIFNIEQFQKWMKGVTDRGLHEKVFILAGVTPFKSWRAAEYMATKVPGMDVPAALVERMKGAPKEKAKATGVDICVELIEQLREIPGVKGIHLMAIEWEEIVPEIAKRAGLLPRPEVA